MHSKEALTRAIEKCFEDLSCRWRTDLDSMDLSPSADGPDPRLSVFLRSPAKVEQTFDGINAQLWDDPFEWTLPEAMDSRERVDGYLDEVDEARSAGFRRIVSDADLAKVLRTPFGETTLADLLLATLCDAVRLAAAARADVSVRGKT